jgi:hypothetical protein
MSRDAEELVDTNGVGETTGKCLLPAARGRVEAAA